MGANLLILFATNFLVQLPPSSPQPPPQHQQPDSLGPEERPGPGIGYERLPDALAYDRVQGLSLGAGYRLPLGAPAVLYATLRYGLSDERITGRLSLVHQSARVRYTLAGYDDVTQLNPLAAARSLSNSANALFAGHDNGDYLLASGGALGVEMELGPALDLALEGRVERQSTVDRVAESAVNDFLGGSGRFPPNPGVTEGTFAAISAGVRGLRRTRWELALDLLSGAGRTVPRIRGQVGRHLGPHRIVRLAAKAGVETRPTHPQMLFRLGGLATVRGFEYGTVRGQSFWAAQVDFAPLRGRIAPVLFLDAGQAADLSGLFSSTALVGAGAGISLLRGLVRLELSHPLAPDTGGKLRFDLVVEGGR
jgi:hypothetical protein